MSVYMEHAARNIFFFTQLKAVEFCFQRSDEIPHNKRFVGNFFYFSCGDFTEIYNIVQIFKVVFAIALGLNGIVKNMKRVIIFIFGINSVTSEPSAEPVAAFVHNGNRRYNSVAAESFPRFIEYGAYSASRRISEFTYKNKLIPKKIKKTSAPSGHYRLSCERLCSRLI